MSPCTKGLESYSFVSQFNAKTIEWINYAGTNILRVNTTNIGMEAKKFKNRVVKLSTSDISTVINSDTNLLYSYQLSTMIKFVGM